MTVRRSWAFLTELEFVSVVPRVPAPSGGPAEGEQQSFDTTPDAPEVDYRTVDTAEALEALLSELDSPQGFAFDTETTAVDAMSADLVGLSFSNSPHVGWYVPVGHSEGRQLALDDVLEALRPVFESETVPEGCAQRQLRYDRAQESRHRGARGHVRTP